MTAQSPIYSEIPTLTLPQALETLAHAYRALDILDTAYAALDQRLTAQFERAQYLSNALAGERAARLALQAELADAERHIRYGHTTGSTVQERTVGQ